MASLLYPLWLLLTCPTQADLVRQIEYLKAENQVLRSKLPKRVTVTSAKRRRLLKFGLPLGPAIRQLISIVTPRTFSRWATAEWGGGGGRPRSKPKKKPGRPRTPEDIRLLILQLARENSWGSTRILGELKKLGIRKVSRTTVANILREHGFDPVPQRGHDSWDAYVKRHAQTIWACDFATKPVWTTSELRDHFILFFIHLGSRRVFASGITDRPTAEWVTQQARNFCLHAGDQPRKPTMLLRDNDGKYAPGFDAVLRAEGTKPQPLTPGCPNLNAHAERFVQTLQRECLDHFVIFGEKHLRYLVFEFLEHYHTERPHQALGNQPLSGTPPDDTNVDCEIRCRQRLGGLLKHYYRAAA